MDGVKLATVVASLFVVGTAHALPGGEAGSLPMGAVTLHGIDTSPDGRVVGAAGTGGLYIWHEAAFSSPIFAGGCDVAESVVFVESATFGDRFYVGCGSEGTIYVVEVDDSTPPVANTPSAVVLNDGIGAVTELAWADGDDYVHAVVQDGSTYSLHRFDVAGTGTDGGGLPLLGTGTVAAMTVGVDAGAVLVADTRGVMSWVSRNTGTYSASTSPPVVVQGSTLDMVTSEWVTTSLWADSTSGDVWTLSNVTASTTATRFLSGIADPSALGFVYDGSVLRLWLGRQDGTIEAYGADDAELDGSLSIDGSYAVEFAMPSSGDDPVYVRASDSTVRVVSDRPWIDGITATPDTVQDGDTFTITFTPDADGDYDIRDGGPDADDGSSIATGRATADVEVSVELSVDDLEEEGDNRLFVYLEDDAGNVGKDSVVVNRDTPPEVVTGLSAEGGDNKLVVTWTSSDDPDIDHYELYLSDVVFTGEGDLPAFAVLVNEGEDDERTDDYPMDVEWTAASTQHSVTLEGLVNDTVYYLTVVSIDSSDLESGPATVVTGIPVATCAASECAGDTYGCTCAPNSIAAAPLRPRALAWAAFLLAILAPVARRR